MHAVLARHRALLHLLKLKAEEDELVQEHIMRPRDAFDVRYQLRRVALCRLTFAVCECYILRRLLLIICVEFLDCQIRVDPVLYLEQIEDINVDLSQAYLVLDYLDLVRCGLVVLRVGVVHSQSARTLVPLAFD